MTNSNIRRFNDVDKRKLDLEDVILDVDWSEEPYTITRLRISNEAKNNIIQQGVSLGSKVYLDVESRWSHLRYFCGTVADIGHDTVPVDDDGDSILPNGVGHNAKFRVTIVGTDKSFVRETPTLPFEGNIEDLVILKPDEDLGPLPFEIDPPSVDNGNAVAYVRISTQCWFEMKNELVREDSALQSILFLEAVRSSARSFRECIQQGGQPENEEVFKDWVSYFVGKLGVELPNQGEDDLELLKDWENDVVKSLANIQQASKVIKEDLERGGD